MSKFTESFAVVIGINDYQNGIDKLQTAVSDAAGIAEILRDTYRYTLINPDCDFEAIVDSCASKDKLEKLLTDILPNKIKPTDRLIFYFAGHGIARNSDDEPQGFLVPQDADMKDLDSLLRMSDVHDWLAKLECKHLLVILDCCFAGAFRWASYRKLIPIAQEITKAHYDRFIRFPAWQVLTSASHNQEALELLNNRDIEPDRKHSPFAEGLIEALKNDKADLNGDGVIIATELYQYLRDYVEINSEERQTPGFFPLRKHDRGEYLFKLSNFARDELPEPPELNQENNPYRGLEPFEERHAQLFFGQKEVIKELSKKVTQKDNQLTVVTGISGSGKSSLVKAGLIPNVKRLERRSNYKLSLIYACILTLKIRKKIPSLPIKFLPITFIHRWLTLEPVRPGINPLNSLNRALSPLNKNSNSSEKPIELIQNWSKQNPQSRLLLVIDQFEELITLSPKIEKVSNSAKKTWWERLRDRLGLTKQEPESDREEEKTEQWSEFVELLAEILDKCPQLSLVVTLRSDFEPRFQESAFFRENWANARFLVRPMRSDELREVVEKPATEKALYFEPPELVDRLVDEVSQMPGALPLLSFTLSEMYIKLHEAWVKEGKEDRALTVVQDFDLEGGVAGVLTRRANEEYRTVPTPRKAHRTTMRKVMLRMVEMESGEAVRRRVLASELVYSDEEENKLKEAILNQLLEARLIVTGTDTESSERYYEPAHDFLVRGWGRLQRWIQEEQTKGNLALQNLLTPAAKAWDRNRVNKDLWNNNSRLDRLREIQDNDDRDDNWLNALETEFVNKSRKLKTKNRRIIISAITIFVSTVSITTIFALLGQRRANISAIQALTKSSEALYDSNKLLLNPLEEALKGGTRLNKLNLNKLLGVEAETYKNLNNALFHAVHSTSEINQLEDKHTFLVTSVDFSSDDQWIASGGKDKKLNIWSRDGKHIQTLSGHEDEILDISFGPNSNLIATSGFDEKVILWNYDNEKWKRFQTLSGHQGHIFDVSFSPNREIIATAGKDTSVKLWRLQNGRWENFYSLENHQEQVNSVDFSPDGKILATGSRDHKVILWDLKTNSKKIELNHINTNGDEQEEIDVYSVNFSPDGKTLATAGQDGIVRIWNLNGDKVSKFKAHQTIITQVKFSPDGKYIATTSWDNSVKFWSTKGKEIQKIVLTDGISPKIDFSNDSDFLATTSQNGTIRLWSVGKQYHINLNPLRTIKDIDWSSDGKYLISASWDNAIDENHNPNAKLVKIWGTDIGEEVFSFDGQPRGIRRIQFNPKNENKIATVGNDGLLKLWNFDREQESIQEKEPEVIDGHNLPFDNPNLEALAFSSDGKLIATADYTGQVIIWHLNGTKPQKLQPPINVDPSQGFHDVAFSPDGTILAITNGNLVELWQKEMSSNIFRELITLKDESDGHKSGVYSISFHPNERLIATAGDDKTTKLWDYEGKLLQTLKEKSQEYTHNAVVTDVSFSPDGNLIATASDDTTVKLWKSDGSYIRTLRGHSDDVKSVAFSPDGKFLATAGSDRKVLFWDLQLAQANLDELLDEGCNLLRDYFENNPNTDDESKNICS